MINSDEAYSLMVKKLANEINTSEEAQLQLWLEASIENRKMFGDFERIWNTAPVPDISIDVEAAWQKVDKRTKHKLITINFGAALKIAAAVACFGIIGMLAYNSLNSKQSLIQTAANEVKKVELPDGTNIWLHEHSSVSYNSNFNGNDRNVALKGLAFFDVKRDENRPFNITTPKGNIEVLGTSFEVSAYERDTFERVTVSTGKVKFEGINSKGFILVKDQEGIISKNSGHVNNVNSAELVSWKELKLNFNDEPMAKVAEKISRYYHVKVILLNSKIDSCRFTGSYTNPKLNEVLDEISKALQLTYKHQSGRILLNGEGCSIPEKK